MPFLSVLFTHIKILSGTVYFCSISSFNNMMYRVYYYLILLFVSVIFICSCSGKPERSRKPVSTVELSPSSKNYTFGQSLTLNISTKLKNGTLKKVEVFYNNQSLFSSNKTNFSVTIPILNSLGINSVHVVSEKTDGISNTRSVNFTVLSDITPKKLNYTVVRDFSHSIDHFTQGLQLFDGFLYEGTGENGKSKLYKIHLSNNQIIQNVSLPEKYFGEGITILDNKIYQLTYKQQIGFIYNLSNFAMIDSFRFASQEGWGLTNDGKSLIMSDGTGVLTWLNPENFSVEKKLQVADRFNIIQNLNELEYDNGYIWANIWTTNQIIKLDAKTGKVLGFLDLKGILSVMNVSSSQRIDVLNGIALFPENKHLLITGKLWPKMFEINVISSE
jgi:glutaminyl-peptide cyclotransferase